INIGETKSCTVTNYQMPSGLVTDSLLCRFGQPVADQFRLLYQRNTGNNYTLNASNPGQFYYNVIANASGAVTMNIPYPFITQGTMPIHVYPVGQFDFDPVNQCFKPGQDSAADGTQVTFTSTYNDFGKFYTVTIQNVPAGAYVNIHLDYGFKGTSPWQSQANNDAKKGNQTIHDVEQYNFSSTVPNSA